MGSGIHRRQFDQANGCSATCKRLSQTKRKAAKRTERDAFAKLMEQIGQQAPETKPVFELNPEHQLVKHLNDVQDEDNFAQWADVLLDQALLAERGSLKDPAGFVSRLNKLMLDLSK